MKILLFYTDPGSGAMLLQVLLAFFAGGLFYFRHFVRSFFGWGPTNAAQLETKSRQKDDDVETNA